MADENEALWRVYLTWSSLLTNLQENVLVDETDAGRLAAHYRFLSGYAHPVADQISNTYGRSAFANWPVFDRYSGELVLLYAITLGILELEHFTASLALQGLESLVDKGRDPENAARGTCCHLLFLVPWHQPSFVRFVESGQSSRFQRVEGRSGAASTRWSISG
jgi:hypothetical protein